MIKHDGDLRTRGKCRKHSPAARVFNIFLVFSNARRVLSQCNTRLRVLYLLNNPFRLLEKPSLDNKRYNVHNSSGFTVFLARKRFTASDKRPFTTLTSSLSTKICAWRLDVYATSEYFVETV